MGCKKGKTLSSTDWDRNVILRARRVGGGGIYRIVFSENDRVYIGSTNNFLMRKAIHFFDLSDGHHHNKRLQTDYDLFGFESFIFEPILEVPPLTNKEALLKLEQRHIDELNPFYNIERLVVNRPKRVVAGVRILSCKEPKLKSYTPKKVAYPKKKKKRNPRQFDTEGIYGSMRRKGKKRLNQLAKHKKRNLLKSHGV